MIDNNTPSFYNGKKLTLNSSEECQWLKLVLDAVNRNTTAIYNSFTHTPAVFIVGTTTGAPVNGQSSWTISTINVIGKNPVFLLGGIVKVSGTDYTFNNSTGTFTLASGTFATGNTWTVIY